MGAVVEDICVFCHHNSPSLNSHDSNLSLTFACNNVDCHGGMVNASGTEILNAALHNNGEVDATCSSNGVGCHDGDDD
ncbi:MAG: hypothetical protein JXX14_11255 [Deltaproteobacteria bacterium]|nr:hypothetical protein [Deltaproteobacteria bacterium]